MIPLRSMFMIVTPVLCIAALEPVRAETTTAPPPQEEKPTPYDNRLSRLSEILGSVQYLRSLCNPGKEDTWRTSMEALLTSDTRDEPKRREVLTAAFNRGYRSFASVYTDCTPAAVVAEDRYRNEGATLAAEIAAKFGN